jgi:hexosaminidase
MPSLRLLPYPRSLQRRPGFYTLPQTGAVHLDPALPRDTVLLPLAERLQAAAKICGSRLQLVTGSSQHPGLVIRAAQTSEAPPQPDGYLLTVAARGVSIRYREPSGLRCAIATFRQLLREHGPHLPQLTIRDHADFPRRGVMLDVSRGRVPNLQTLLDLVDHLADFKINELQLYTEHTFAYRNYEPVWRGWGPLTGDNILRLDARCRQLGIDLVPNQNSFGHLRYWLEFPPLKPLSEVNQPYEGTGGGFLRHPTTLAPNHPGTLPFLQELYDELLPHFTSRRFNVGCDETWDLGRGQSKHLCEAHGKGQVYVDFLNKLAQQVVARGRQMLIWGDIILHYPKLISKLPEDIIALNWGYEANHPFEREASIFRRSRIPFYVCPGTSTWMTLLGRHDNAFANLRAGAEAGRRHGAIGYLNTDWGDGGHPQPLAVSYLPYLAGAAFSWCARSFRQDLLVPVLSRDVFADPTQHTARAAMALGFAHRKFDYYQPNVTPFGAVIAAPIPRSREIPCRDGLKYYARISGGKIQAALEEVQTQREVLARSRPTTRLGEILALELDLAARMALQSCKIMLWQQALAGGNLARARQMAGAGVRELVAIEKDFRTYWPLRNQGTTAKCCPFFRWRIRDYRSAALHFPHAFARLPNSNTNPAD